MPQVLILGFEQASYANNDVTGHHVKMTPEVVLGDEVVKEIAQVDIAICLFPR